MPAMKFLQKLAMMCNTVYKSEINKINVQVTEAGRNRVKQITAADSFRAMTNDKTASVGG
jgi:hypothetical protein